jgi:hypothetical protein
MKNKPFVKNSSNESEVRDAEVKAKLSQQNYDAQLKAVLSTDQGKAVIWKLLGDCRIFQTSFTGSSETFFLEGKRSIGLSILTDIMRVDPESFVKMQQMKAKEF